MEWERQRELEAMSRHWGKARFQRRQRVAREAGDEARLGAARTLLKEAIGAVEATLDEWMGAQKKDRTHHMARKYIEQTGTGVAAYLACRAVLGRLSERTPIRGVAGEIAHQMITEIKCRRFQEHAPGLFTYRMNSFTTSSQVHMARSMSATMVHALCENCRKDKRRKHCPHLDTSDLNLHEAERAKLGMSLIRAVMESFPGWLEQKSVKEVQGTKAKKRIVQNAYLVATEEAKEWLEHRNDLLAELAPMPLPMVVPPLPWGPGEQVGGYRFDLLNAFPMVRSSKRHQARVAEAEIPMVYEALNRIQETPWRINREVYGVVEEIMARGGALAGLPSSEPVAIPARPPQLDLPDPDRDILRAWKKAASKAHDEEYSRHQEIRKWVNLRTVVEEVKDEEAIWFPHSLDFRGRIYPIPQGLQPQGSDLEKGLLTFADGEALGDRGARWLAIHGANCLGETPEGAKVSKMTLQERVDWVVAHEDRIISTAQDPFADLWWTDADEPWQFLAYCFEWAAMCQWAAEPGQSPSTYICTLPVSLDGSCNGLQHFAGMLRDKQGAKAVNVWPNETPKDVYEVVAEAVLDILTERAGKDDMAVRWLASGLVNRKLCKRPTMTFGYGSKPYGMTDQIASYMRLDVAGWPEIEAAHFANEEGGSLHRKAAAYMSQVLWQALSQVVKGGFEAMGWMQKCAREVAKTGRAVAWTTPETNFPVMQDGHKYWTREQRRVNTYLAGGVLFKPVVSAKGASPNTVRQANGVAPNVVHSLDAAALQITVCMASHDGVEHFAMVHDSYGTLPSRMDTLWAATRQAFFHMYSRHDVVEELYHEWLNQVDDLAVLETPPDLGDLDISMVLGSEYFFA